MGSVNSKAKGPLARKKAAAKVAEKAPAEAKEETAAKAKEETAAKATENAAAEATENAAEHSSMIPRRIHFYRQEEVPYGCFSNFSDHPVAIGGSLFSTSEHYFQAMKFEGTPYFEEVRCCDTPGESAKMGRRRDLPLRPDWEVIKNSVMFDVCLAKFTQHPQLTKVLLSTGDAKLVEHTRNDRYWGDGGDGTGGNWLGKTLMAVREEIRRRRDDGGCVPPCKE